MDRDTAIKAIRDGGVVGAGGAGFPTHVKLGAPVETLLVNAAECEPLLHVDIHLLGEHLREVADGIAVAVGATGAKRAILGIKERYSALKGHLEGVFRGAGMPVPVEVALLPNTYPMGDEHVLVHACTGRRVPPGGLPLAVGVAVMNVETLLNVSRAVHGRPVTTKFVTVGGDVPNPFTTEVPIGFPVAALLAAAGHDPSVPGVIVDGGPMMGKAVDASAPVTKTTKGILVFRGEHPVALSRSASVRSREGKAEEVCCQCRGCTDVCPRYALGHDLEPHRMMRSLPRVRALEAGGVPDERELALLSTAFLCSECGACEVMGCTMGLSPRAVNAAVKKALASRGLRMPIPPVLADRPPGAVGAVSSARLVRRAGLREYDRETPFMEWKAPVDGVRIPLRQHVGVPAVPVVSAGDKVARGQVLAEVPEGALGATIHAGIDGTVEMGEGYIIIRENGGCVNG